MVDVCFVVTFRHQTDERSTSIDSDLHAEVGSCSPTLQRALESFASGCLEAVSRKPALPTTGLAQHP